MSSTDAPAALLHVKATSLIALELGGITYGALIALGIACLSAFHHPRNKPKRRQMFTQYWTLQAHVMLILLMNTALQGWHTRIYTKEVVYTDINHLTHFERNRSHIFTVLVCALTDGLLVWRCYMVHRALYSNCPGGLNNLCWIFPLILWVAGVSLGMVAVLSLNPNAPYTNPPTPLPRAMIIFTASLVLNLLINIFATSNIIIRLLRYRRYIATAFGHSNTLVKFPLRISGILLESAAINVVLVVVLFIGMVLPDGPGVSIMVDIMVPGQSIASVLVTYQVAVGRAISPVKEEQSPPRDRKQAPLHDTSPPHLPSDFVLDIVPSALPYSTP